MGPTERAGEQRQYDDVMFASVSGVKQSRRDVTANISESSPVGCRYFEFSEGAALTTRPLYMSPDESPKKRCIRRDRKGKTPFAVAVYEAITPSKSM